MEPLPSTQISKAFKRYLIENKSEKEFPNGAHYLTLIYRSKGDDFTKKFIIYPTYSSIPNLPDVPITIPIINCECGPDCVFDLEHFITYLEKILKVNTLDNQISCPNRKCAAKRSLKNYQVDYGYEYILKDYKRLLELKAVGQMSKSTVLKSMNSQQSLSFSPFQSFPRGKMKINVEGYYTFFENDEMLTEDFFSKFRETLEKFRDIKIAKFMNTLADEKNKNAENNMMGAEESKTFESTRHLYIKPNYLSSFQQRLETLIKPNVSNIRQKFCVMRLLTDPEKRFDSHSYFNQLVFWFPNISDERKRFLPVQLLKDNKDVAEVQNFNYFAALIRVPMVGAWITGGAEKPIDQKSNPVNKCYEVALQNISLLGRIRCVSKPNLPLNMMGHAGICVGDFIYVVGGGSGEEALKSTFKIKWNGGGEMANKWHVLKELNHARFYHSLTNIEGQDAIYCIGGCYSEKKKMTPVHAIEKYEIENNRWVEVNYESQEPIKPTIYPMLMPSKGEIIIWSGLNPGLRTSLTNLYSFDVERRRAVELPNDLKTSDRGAFDFIDQQTIQSQDRMLFLGPFRSRTRVLNYYFDLKERKLVVNKKFLDEAQQKEGSE